ncbi:thiamine phosphate synthase [Sphingobacterium griseoflavum]|uniref:Thiamine-phosphate synthase n=1 Tax=Sphingobacterium griseoflavum TaxID=1474952 RepID=A0ABQ3HW59_9SPHI|nr:thiamine phosphate synthase [Sphingobacterium griseoflavum]GHE33572.1 thiamine-phosphate synthase [Sphingobacterium griseoflavum]
MSIDPTFPYPLYLVISERDCVGRPWLWVAEQAMLGGIDIIQLREKDLSKKDFFRKAWALKQLTEQYEIPLIINDAVDIAVDVDAWGVHVGQQDRSPLSILEQYGDQLRIGWSIENLAQLNSNQVAAVHHLAVSPVFATATKLDTITEWGIDGIRTLRMQTDKPLIAIGKMNVDTAAKALAAGANSIAVVSAICAAPEPRKASERLKKMLIS